LLIRLGWVLVGIEGGKRGGISRDLAEGYQTAGLGRIGSALRIYKTGRTHISWYYG